MTMNPQRAHLLTHFGPLFVTALSGWMSFNLVNSGTTYIVPGIIVAALLAYGGTLVALRTRAVHDLRPAYPAARRTEQFSTIAAARGSDRISARPAFDAMDIAAGD